MDNALLLDLGVEELEDLNAPGWKYWAGVAAGVAVIGGAVAVGVAIT